MKAISHYWQTINAVSIALSPVSGLFCLLVLARQFLYRYKIFKSFHSHIPVIVVGNIYVGGNGKTPFVIWLVEQLKQKGYKPAVVSRGYGASSEQENGLSWPRQVNAQQSPHLFGDEPVIIQRATHCPVFIDPDRKRAVAKIASTTDCNVIVSDDGLQHYAMSRFIEINITDARRLYGNQLCLPAGPLREPVQRLNSIDYIVYNISRIVTDHTKNSIPKNAFAMDYELLLLQRLQPLLSGSRKEKLKTEKNAMTLYDFKGKIVHAVAGIGDPQAFFMILKNYGLVVIEHAFADHYQYQKEDFLFTDSHPIIMTEKDAVKCHSFLLSNAWYLPVKAKIDQTLLNKIVQQLDTFGSL